MELDVGGRPYSVVDLPFLSPSIGNMSTQNIAHAFEALYRRHHAWAASLAFRFTGDRDRALDVAQDGFINEVDLRALDRVIAVQEASGRPSVPTGRVVSDPEGRGDRGAGVDLDLMAKIALDKRRALASPAGDDSGRTPPATDPRQETKPEPARQ